MTTKRYPRINNYRVVTQMADEFASEYMTSQDAAADWAEMRKMFPRMEAEFIELNLRDSAAYQMRKELWKVMDQEKAKSAKRIDMTINIAIVLIAYLVAHLIF